MSRLKWSAINYPRLKISAKTHGQKHNKKSKKSNEDYIRHAATKVIDRIHVALAEVTQAANENAKVHVQFADSRW